MAAENRAALGRDGQVFLRRDGTGKQRERLAKEDRESKLKGFGGGKLEGFSFLGGAYHRESFSSSGTSRAETGE